jgi:hypothetical protein
MPCFSGVGAVTGAGLEKPDYLIPRQMIWFSTMW